MHIYGWLDKFPYGSFTEEEAKVYEFLDFRTRPACYQYENKDKLKGLQVFCVFNDVKNRIVGASRLGDVWLTENLESEKYDKRVDIEQCSDFSYIYKKD